MKAGWITKPLGEVCEIYQPQTITTKEMVLDGKYPVFGANGIIGRYDKYNHEEPQLLITCRGATCGSVNVSEPFSWITGNAMVVRPKNSDIDLKMLEYIFRGAVDISKVITGAAQPQITRANLAPVQISFPSSHQEQQRIVTILDQAFEGIATATANAEKNLANAREVFESELQSAFTTKGQGWVEKKIGECCTLRSGTTVNASLEKTTGEIPYLKVADMSFAGNETEVISSSRFLNKADVGKNSILPAGTTIFPKRGGAILTNKKRLTAVPICADLNIMGVIPSDSLMPKLVYFYFLNVDMRILGSGATLPQINNYDIEPLVINYPESLDEQLTVINKLDELSTETKRLELNYQQKLVALDELKKSILNQAFSGQLN